MLQPETRLIFLYFSQYPILCISIASNTTKSLCLLCCASRAISILNFFFSVPFKLHLFHSLTLTGHHFTIRHPTIQCTYLLDFLAPSSPVYLCFSFRLCFYLFCACTCVCVADISVSREPVCRCAE
jgi:hypothetical protein